ncbi:MAG: nucleoside deaminase [Oscillospiraceae bacterium]|jgi:tRNA(adenine34) deaminase|nr:nucleoside deaminase [Oscillospiraceae bacterium]
MTSEDETYMRRALELARQAALADETPVGAVVVHLRTGQIVGEGRNRRENGKNALYHAEVEAIDSACKALGGWRLWECALYVTLEPCPMCAGALINARIARVVFGADDPKAGCCGSVTDLFALPFNHRPPVEGGCLAAECTSLLRAFFAALRKKKS